MNTSNVKCCLNNDWYKKCLKLNFFYFREKKTKFEKERNCERLTPEENKIWQEATLWATDLVTVNLKKKIFLSIPCKTFPLCVIFKRKQCSCNFLWDIFNFWEPFVKIFVCGCVFKRKQCGCNFPWDTSPFSENFYKKNFWFVL